MHLWESYDDQANFRVVVGSVGPCLDPCDARNWDNVNLTEPTEIAVTNFENFIGLIHNRLYLLVRYLISYFSRIQEKGTSFPLAAQNASLYHSRKASSQ